MIYLQSAGSPLSGIPFLIAVVAVFYFFILRPQMKKQKDQDRFSKDIEKGDTVVTSAGIIGKINKIDGAKITIETAGKTHIQVLKSAISKEMTDALNSSSEEA